MEGTHRLSSQGHRAVLVGRRCAWQASSSDRQADKALQLVDDVRGVGAANAAVADKLPKFCHWHGLTRWCKEGSIYGAIA